MLLRQGLLMGLRGAAKLLPPAAPFVIPAASFATFAVTFALGRAAAVYLRGLAAGRPAAEDEIRETFRTALAAAWARRGAKGE
jgi:hypothetical protein